MHEQECRDADQDQHDGVRRQPHPAEDGEAEGEPHAVVPVVVSGVEAVHLRCRRAGRGEVADAPAARVDGTDSGKARVRVAHPQGDVVAPGVGDDEVLAGPVCEPSDPEDTAFLHRDDERLGQGYAEDRHELPVAPVIGQYVEELVPSGWSRFISRTRRGLEQPHVAVQGPCGADLVEQPFRQERRKDESGLFQRAVALAAVGSRAQQPTRTGGELHPLLLGLLGHSSGTPSCR